ncbi:uncharacterized protein BJ171DRAFT_630730 [Polychytrium aggregatum]|uniref:uncharacterized protein n=1 Tax=Polychytrium aggregatum TaxID=110093 RepID=UPI0022FF3F15|nr:uncharacterized protein BJ171DRAFT_630730 [Polychytrium aggregatum]KAI9199617.1 hypothetical protein BJ171DRAFT_630730 [Polychytrium aggregatum]
MFDAFPAELVYRVLALLPRRELDQLRLVCRGWNQQIRTVIRDRNRYFNRTIGTATAKIPSGIDVLGKPEQPDMRLQALAGLMMDSSSPFSDRTKAAMDLRFYDVAEYSDSLSVFEFRPMGLQPTLPLPHGFGPSHTIAIEWVPSKPESPDVPKTGSSTSLGSVTPAAASDPPVPTQAPSCRWLIHGRDRKSDGIFVHTENSQAILWYRIQTHADGQRSFRLLKTHLGLLGNPSRVEALARELQARHVPLNLVDWSHPSIRTSLLVDRLATPVLDQSTGALSAGARTAADRVPHLTLYLKQLMDSSIRELMHWKHQHGRDLNLIGLSLRMKMIEPSKRQEIEERGLQLVDRFLNLPTAPLLLLAISFADTGSGKTASRTDRSHQGDLVQSMGNGSGNNNASANDDTGADSNDDDAATLVDSSEDLSLDHSQGLHTREDKMTILSELIRSHVLGNFWELSERLCLRVGLDEGSLFKMGEGVVVRPLSTLETPYYFCPKIPGLDPFLQYIHHVFDGDMLDKQLYFSLTRRRRFKRLDLHSKRQRTVHEMCKQVIDQAPRETEVVIAFGNALWKQGKGYASSPRRLRFAKYFEQFIHHQRRPPDRSVSKIHVCSVNEFNTSQVCSHCRDAKRLEKAEHLDIEKP